ncbi:hypothetical protein, partial [Tepidicella xavieri]|uniref:hypothetical protein n=1 Tax=Tepidicella xavieri TaxID=360241 RepID=UPI001B87E107
MSTQENRPTGGRLRAWFFCPTKKNGPVKTRPFGREACIVTALQKKYSIFRACRPLRLYARKGLHNPRWGGCCRLMFQMAISWSVRGASSRP